MVQDKQVALVEAQDHLRETLHSTSEEIARAVDAVAEAHLAMSLRTIDKRGPKRIIDSVCGLRCRNCASSFEQCSSLLARNGDPCCNTCMYTDTHDAKKVREVVPAYLKDVNLSVGTLQNRMETIPTPEKRIEDLWEEFDNEEDAIERDLIAIKIRNLMRRGSK